VFQTAEDVEAPSRPPGATGNLQVTRGWLQIVHSSQPVWRETMLLSKEQSCRGILPTTEHRRVFQVGWTVSGELRGSWESGR